MEANELRLGNYIRDEFGDIRQIWALGKTSIEFAYGIVDIYENCTPVELTEEWILKAGFIKHKEDGIYGSIYSIGIHDYRYTLTRDWRKEPSYMVGIEYTDSPNEAYEEKIFNFSFECKAVHQLQNLYFILTGEELTINT